MVLKNLRWEFMVFGILIRLPFTQQQHYKKDETYRCDTLCDSYCKSIRDCTFCSGRNFECDLFADRIHLEGNFLAFARAVELCHRWRTRCLVSVKHTKKEAQIPEKREREMREKRLLTIWFSRIGLLFLLSILMTPSGNSLCSVYRVNIWLSSAVE